MRSTGGRTVLAVLLLVGLAATARGVPAAMREILATGDAIPGFGRIGIFGVGIRGLDERGRVLISGQISDGRQGLYRVDGRRIVPLWSTGTPEGRPVCLHAGLAASSPGGLVAVIGEADDSCGVANRQDAIYLLADGEVRRLVKAGDQGPQGERFCGVYFGGTRPTLPVNDEGTVAFGAEAVGPGETCEYGEDHRKFFEGLYLVDREGSIRTVARSGEESLAGWVFDSFALLGITIDGAVIFQATGFDRSVPEEGSQSGVFAGDGELVHPLVVDGFIGPSGDVLRDVAALAISPSGQILFRASGNDGPGVFRFVGGEIVRLPDRLPAGFEYGSGHVLSDRSTITLTATWLEPREGGGHTEVNGVYVLRSDGDIEVIRDAGNAFVNSAGDVAYETVRGNAPVAAVRRRGAREATLVANGDPAPGGGHFGAQGMGESLCLGESGLVGALVFGGDQTAGLVCGADSNFGTITAQGSPAPDGGELSSVGRCHIHSEHEILFAATKTERQPDGTNLSLPSLYRATPEGVEEVIGPKDAGTPDSPLYIESFATDAAGTAVVRTGIGNGGTFLRARRGHPVERLPIASFRFEGGIRVANVSEYGLADDGTIVATVRLWDDGPYPSDEATAIVLFSGEEGRLLATVRDLPGGPYERIGGLHVAGDHIVFSVFESWRSTRAFRQRLGDPTPQEILPLNGGFSSFFVIDLTPEGRVLFVAATAANSGGPFSYYVLDGDELRFVFEESRSLDNTAVALNDRGNLLLRSYRSLTGGFRYALQLTGPHVDDTCLPAVTSGSESSSGNGCQVRQSSHRSTTAAALVLGMVVLLALRGRRRR